METNLQPTSVDQEKLTAEHQQRPKFQVNIEGMTYDWDQDTITVPEIRELGKLPTNLPVIEVDLKDNSERTLPETETVHLKPGMGFGKKVGYKRGSEERVQQELLMLRGTWPDL